jgi:CheY-like chemotaxis protein
MHHPALQVLVVEDHDEAARNLSALLTAQGHVVHVAPDGPSAVRLASQGTPDVALIDVNLPGAMDGYQVAQALRDGAGERRPLLVVLTGQTDPQSRERSRREGIDLHLTKPAEPDHLRAVLRRFADILWPPEVA